MRKAFQEMEISVLCILIQTLGFAWGMKLAMIDPTSQSSELTPTNDI